MYDKLRQLITEGDYREALYEFQEEYFHIGERSDKEAAQLCVLEASIWEALGDGCSEFEAISRGMSYEQGNYELFYMLGLYYMDVNIDKAFLCIQMALFYCDSADDKKIIEELYLELKNDSRVRVRNTSIMILSYNDLELLRLCIKAIEEFLPHDSFEVVVVDNASTEPGVIDFLRGKKESADYTFKLIESSENLGFPKGCNLGAGSCSKENDILFLNNDAVLTQNALFWLRMGLYEGRGVGACSALSNSASLQEISPAAFERFAGKRLDDMWHKSIALDESIRIFESYAAVNSIPKIHPYIKRFRLTGYALLVSRQALSAVAADDIVFDERFSPGYFEDDDLGIRIARAGFEQYLCDNSFIYHNGGSGFSGHSDAMERSRGIFQEKWGFDIWGFCLHWEEAADRVIEIASERKEPLRVIDFSCGLGATASYLKHIFPDMFVAGVCRNAFLAGIAKTVADETAWGDLNTAKLPWADHSFDIAIIEKEFVSKARASQFIKSSGIIIDDDSLTKG